ncbi:hypothetical protein [Streptomyces sp. SDr-06]|uniref:hypothetical protein n=1 Tax=Streptomyces sp. SDr-06 TaxID=2267702 RepID=UPI00167A13B4|nr:hypothetical protein [Streptomyces sp. SDr-06]
MTAGWAAFTFLVTAYTILAALICHQAVSNRRTRQQAAARTRIPHQRQGDQ